MATAEIIAPGSTLALLPQYEAKELFAPGFIDPLIDRIRAEVRAIPTDISTPKGREAVAALAYKVGRSKTFIDAQRLALVADEKKRLQAIDIEGARVWDVLEDLQKEVRKPLTDWENAEKDRVAAHESALSEIVNAGPHTLQNWQTLSVEAMHDRLNEIKTEARDWQEFGARGRAATSVAVGQIEEAIAKRVKADDERAELERLRAEAVERERVERDARIAREATERAEAAARGREAQAARDAEAERQRIEREKHEAEARAKQAEAQKIAAEQLAEKRRIEAEAQAKRDQEAAVEAERRRIEAQHQAEREATEKREQNKRHVAKINREVMEALMAHGYQVSEAQARTIIKALADGLIPHTKISY